MKALFKIDYHTTDSERVCIESQNGDIILNRYKGTLKSDAIDIDTTQQDSITYNYKVIGGKSPRAEWGEKRTIRFSKEIENCCVIDQWRDIPQDRSLYSSLFTESIFKRSSPSKATLRRNSIMVTLAAPEVTSQQDLYMVGSCKALGEWSPEHGVKMCDSDFPYWQSPAMEITDELLGAEYKFVVIDRTSGEVIAWERGENHSLICAQGVDEESIFVEQSPAHFDIAPWRGAGVAIPLFSLRSEESMGVGEFLDLKKMVDWAAATDQKIIQILPINDTTMYGTWEDSYPYNANSIFALHPLYISLKRVGELSNRAEMAKVEAEGKRLNTLEAVDYEAVNRLKQSYLRQIYTEKGAETISTSGFQEFLSKNSYWLESYALFSLLRDKYSSPNFSKWGKESEYSNSLLEHYKTTHPLDLGYYYFVQYHLHCQLLEARSYALSKGVAFKGDIPIGVSRTSVDVWVNPELFNLNSQAGAPPDAFSAMGQNWGFPTYNWQQMALDGYSWWKARFAKMAEYFDAYRIDHILGFFRIWEIPLDAIHGLLGYFNPALPYSPSQMWEQYGFPFDPSQATPAINDWILNQTFGAAWQDIATRYFTRTGNDTYAFGEEYNSQAKIAEKVDDSTLREALLSLSTEILFIEDPKNAGHFHPRIAAQNTYKYRAMSSHDKECYDKLYNDFFYHRHNDFWAEQALKKLPTLISATNMLTCGEDLGMIPHCVPSVMEHEHILSLEIQRMPKDPSLRFGEPWRYPYRSVCTTSTHDMNPLRAWLREDRDESNRYFKEVLNLDHTMAEDTPAVICERIVAQHMASPAMWTILPLQDWLSIDENLRTADPESERINIPANSRHYWRYRMHCTIEQLLKSYDFNDKVRRLASRG